MATLDRIRVHPIKALDPADRERVQLSPVGGLAGDRTYAIVDGSGEYVNGKRTAAVHRLEADIDQESASTTIGVRGTPERRTFDLDREREALADWLADFFGFDVHLETGAGGELTDSSALGGDPPGATVVSTATLETVAGWFAEVDVESVRRRFRANLEIDGVDAFWEDQLLGGRFRVGDVTFRAIEPVPRCVVPTRDPDTGEETEGFRTRFLERRAETFPATVDRDAFEHLYALTILAAPASADRGGSIAVGDPVEELVDADAGRATDSQRT